MTQFRYLLDGKPLDESGIMPHRVITLDNGDVTLIDNIEIHNSAMRGGKGTFAAINEILNSFNPNTFFINPLDFARYELDHARRKYGKGSISYWVLKRKYKKLKKRYDIRQRR